MKQKQSHPKEYLSNLEEEIKNLERAVEYYKNLSDEVAGYNIMVDSSVIFLKRDLEQKRIGYDILHKLHDIIGKEINIQSFFTSTLELILTTLKMDRAVVLWREFDDSHKFTVQYQLGYSRDEISSSLINDIDVSFFNEMDNPAILFNKATQKNEVQQKFCEQLLMPFLVGTPITNNNVIIGWLIAGREKEARPFYPPLMPSDLETFEVMGGFIKATVSNYQLYSNLERANIQLADYNRELEAKVEERTRDIEISRQELEKEKIKSDGLLLNILPAEVAEELKENGQSEARSLENVTIMFTDFVNFTHFAENMTPAELVSELHVCFTAFDRIVSKHGVEKIKTIGDAYMAAGGMMGHDLDSAANVVRAAIEMQEFMMARTKVFKSTGTSFSMRVGINSGPVIAGIVGVQKFQYDIWGDTVNTASRMESAGIVNAVNISRATYERIKDYPEFSFEYRGHQDAKGKGEMEMWLVS